MEGFIVGLIAGITLMRVMNLVATRPCCKKHFLQHVNDGCQHAFCNGRANHYGYCNLHWWLFKGIR